MIIQVTKNTAQSFDKLVVPELFYPVEREGHYCIGAVFENENENIAAGILIFDVDEGGSDGESLIVVRLRWIYVAEEFRNKGIGNSLMEEFYRVLNDSELYNVICDVPFPEEYDELCSFLENWGFVFKLTDIYDYTAAVGEYLSTKALSGKKPSEAVISISGLEPVEWRHLVKLLKAKYRYNDLSENINDYDKNISCVWYDKNAIKGVLLVKIYGKNTAVPYVLRCINGNNSMIIFNLIVYGLNAAAKKYGNDTKVYVECTADYVADIIAYFFPDAQPLLVRRGIYVVDEMYEDIFGQGDDN